jgi:RNA polymerase sigma-70 factor (ECF subfamily)
MIQAAVTSRQSPSQTETETFLRDPNEESFAPLFKILTPQLVAFFRTRDCAAVAEDLAQEVMIAVYRKAGQVRDRALFRAWLFTIARHVLCRHWGHRARQVETVDLAEVPERLIASTKQWAGTTGFEFNRWMTFLESHEIETLQLRFIEEWEYHEIAAAQTIPIGTVQWRVFNAKKKLAPYLRSAASNGGRKAA